MHVILLRAPLYLSLPSLVVVVVWGASVGEEVSGTWLVVSMVTFGQMTPAPGCKHTVSTWGHCVSVVSVPLQFTWFKFMRKFLGIRSAVGCAAPSALLIEPLNLQHNWHNSLSRLKLTCCIIAQLSAHNFGILGIPRVSTNKSPSTRFTKFNSTSSLSI